MAKKEKAEKPAEAVQKEAPKPVAPPPAPKTPPKPKIPKLAPKNKSRLPRKQKKAARKAAAKQR